MPAGAALSIAHHQVPSVLLVDDDDFIAISLRQYLAARGCHVTVATDRRDAEQRLAERAYDLVLIDPYMTGEASRDSGAFLELLRTLQPAAALVVISAYTSPQLVAAGEAHQALALLTKPQSVVFLSQLVISALRTRTSQMEDFQS